MISIKIKRFPDHIEGRGIGARVLTYKDANKNDFEFAVWLSNNKLPCKASISRRFFIKKVMYIRPIKQLKLLVRIID